MKLRKMSQNTRMYKNDLLKFVFKHSFKRGKFKLTSGKFSDFYLDMKQTTLDPEGSLLIAELLVNKVLKSKADSIGGLMIGADPIIGSVITFGFLQDYHIRGFIVRKQEKKHGLNKLIEGKIREDDRVIIVDDVSTTGSSLYQAVQAAEDLNCKVVKVIPIVDRNEGGRDFFNNKGYDYDPLIKIEEIFNLEHRS